jgi:hypothetical protein
MKTQALKNRLFDSSLALFLTAASLAPMSSSWSAEPEAGNKPMMEGKMEGKMKEQCQEMKDAKEKMSAKMKEQDADLATKVAAMNAAPADQKQALMAGLITTLVGEHTAMHEEKAKMEEKMMKHMMEHMQMGKKSMSECPMMKGMKDHSEHANEDGAAAPK